MLVYRQSKGELSYIRGEDSMLMLEKVMKDAKERLIQLDKALLEKADICSSHGVLYDFPSALYKPYRSFGIGLIVCKRGGFRFSIGSEIFDVVAGETVFLSDDAVFCILDVQKELEVYIFFYSVELIRGLLGNQVQQMQLYVRMSPAEHYVWCTHQEEDLIQYMDLFKGMAGDVEEGNYFLLYEQRLLLLSLTYRLCSIFQRKFLLQEAVSQRRTDVFLQLIELIDRYYMKERGVAFYAEKLGLTPRYVSELSKSVCGYTAQELVFKTIIRRCITVLKSSTRSVAKISEDFNFANPSSFGTFFKKQTGFSPRRFREMNKEK